MTPQPQGIEYWLWIAHGLGPQGLFVVGLLLTCVFAILDMKFFILEWVCDTWAKLMSKLTKKP